MASDMWFREFERLVNQKEAAGVPFDQAAEEAADEAADNIIDRRLEAADRARKIAKGE